jgi:hypothetical protein
VRSTRQETFVLSLNSEEYKILAPHIALAAQFSTGEGFAEHVLKNAELQPEGFPKLKYLTAFNEVLNLTQRAEPTFDLRLLDEDGKTNIISLKQR